jgi:hypothetical protein
VPFDCARCTLPVVVLNLVCICAVVVLLYPLVGVSYCYGFVVDCIVLLWIIPLLPVVFVVVVVVVIPFLLLYSYTVTVVLLSKSLCTCVLECE